MADYSRQPVRVVACVDSPLANECFEQYPWNCTFPGYEVEYIFTIVNGILKLPVVWVRTDSFETVEQTIDNGTADTMGVSFAIRPEYANKWGYMPAYMYDGLALITKISYADSSQPFLLMAGFTWDLWLVIGLITVALLGIRWASRSLRPMLKSSSKLIWSPKVAVLYGTFAFRTRVWYGLWFVLLSVILNFYSNLIAVAIVAPSQVKTAPFTSLNDLGKKLLTKECRLIMPERYTMDNEFNSYLINPKNYNKTWAPLFVQAYLENPPLIAADRDTMSAFIINSTCMVGVDWQTMDVYYTTRYCDINILSYPEEIPLFGHTFYNQRDDIKDALATVISSTAFQTFTEYLTIKYYANKFPPDCMSGRSAAIVVNPTVPMGKVQDSFYILFVGIAFALLVGLIRYVDVVVKRRKMIKWQPNVNPNDNSKTITVTAARFKRTLRPFPIDGLSKSSNNEIVTVTRGRSVTELTNC